MPSLVGSDVCIRDRPRGSFGQWAARSRSIEPPVPCHPARPEKSRLFSAFFIIRLHHFEPGYGGIDRATEFTPKAFSGGTFPRRQDIDAFSIETSGNRRKSGNHRSVSYTHIAQPTNDRV